VHHRTPEEERSSQQRNKQNKKYANAALTEEDRVKEPTTYEEAFRNSEWRKAMEEEINALRQNETWDLVPNQSRRISNPYHDCGF